MTLQDAYLQLMYQLFDIYPESEAKTIADWVIETHTGFSRIDRISNKVFPLSGEQQTAIVQSTKALLQHEPVQYVLEKAYFDHLTLYVNPSVLIPRPETEELVHLIKQYTEQHPVNTVLDIGTGSGCIPILLSDYFPSLHITAIDISEEALAVAKRNSTTYQKNIHFKKMDFLNADSWTTLDYFDIIVSNPPYVKKTESSEMRKNVLDYEPHLALFVPDNDPLIFYKKIAAFALTHLNKHGIVFMEINEALGNDTAAVFEQQGFKVSVYKDMFGKERFISAHLH